MRKQEQKSTNVIKAEIGAETHRQINIVWVDACEVYSPVYCLLFFFVSSFLQTFAWHELFLAAVVLLVCAITILTHHPPPHTRKYQ